VHQRTYCAHANHASEPLSRTVIRDCHIKPLVDMPTEVVNG
jgi:hypothetical protein